MVKNSSALCPQPHNSFSQSLIQGKSYHDTLFKVLLFAIFVIVLTLFPSHPPHEIINKTILTNLWELLHLLCFGIAVAYGLFSSRRNVVETDIELESHYSSIDTTPSFVSTMFPVSCIFGHEYENPCGVDENLMKYCWNSEYFERVPRIVSEDNNFSDSIRYDGTNVVQAWNSEYYYSEPLVVVAKPYNKNDECCGKVFGHKPLGLPIRSLRSNSLEVDSTKYTNESDSSSISKDSSKFEDMSHFNLEQDVHDANVSSTSPMSWHSRSRKKQREGRHSNVTHHPSHFRPLSDNETRFGWFEPPVSEAHCTPTTMHFQEQDMDQKTSSGPPLEDMHSQEENVGQKMSPKDINALLQEEDFQKRTTSRYSSITKGKYNYVSSPSHFRSITVDETQFEQQSFHSKGSYSSHMSTCSSLESASSKNMNLHKEDSRENHKSHGSFSPPSSPITRNQDASLQTLHSQECSTLSSSRSPSPSTRRDQETSLLSLHTRGYSIDSLLNDDMKCSNLSSSSSSASPSAIRKGEAFHSRGYSFDSLLQDDMKSNKNDDLKVPKGIEGEEDSQGNKMHYSLHSKGKSVRTRRGNGPTSEIMRKGELCSKETDEKVEKKKQGNAESVSNRKNKRRIRGSNLPLSGGTYSKQNHDAYCPNKLEATFSNQHKRDKQEHSENVSKQDSDILWSKPSVSEAHWTPTNVLESDIDIENFQVTIDKARVFECVMDSGQDSEVDKKASEFIAKFKAQIRLQRVASMERSKEQRMVGNYKLSDR